MQVGPWSQGDNLTGDAGDRGQADKLTDDAGGTVVPERIFRPVMFSGLRKEMK
jgi:hypothetical protein